MGVKSGLFGGLGGMAGGVVTFGANLVIQTKGEKNLTRLEKQFKKLNQGFVKFGVSTIFIDRLIQSFTRAFDTLNKVLGVGRVTQAAEQFNRLSRFTGISTGRLQAFTAAASKVGAEADDVSDLFQTLTERVDDLRSGTEKGITDDFARFGMSKTTFAGANDGMKQFMVLIRELDKLAPEKRMAALEKLLGGDLARKFGQLGGVQEITAEMRKAVDSGVVLSKQQIDQAVALSSIGRTVRRVVEGISNGLFFMLAPAMTEVLVALEKVLLKVSKFLQLIGPDVGAAIEDYLDPLISRFEAFGVTIETTLMPFAEFLVRLAFGLGLLLAVGGALYVAFAAPWALIVGLSSAALSLGVILEDAFAFFTSDEGFLENAVKNSPALTVALNLIRLAVGFLKIAFLDLQAAVNELVTGPVGASLFIFFKMLAPFVAGTVAYVSFLIAGIGKIIRFGVRLLSILVDLGSAFGMFSAGAFGMLLSPMMNQRGKTNVAGLLTGGLGGLGRAFMGQRGTATEQLAFGTAVPAPNLTINQTNNVTATSSNPSGVISASAAAHARSASSLSGSN